MKKITLLIGLIYCVSVFALAQSITPDPRLEAVYSEEYLQDLANNYPNDLMYKNWYLDNSYTILQVDMEKCEQMPFLKHLDPVNKIVGNNVEHVNEENFNIYMYHIEQQYDRGVSYRIGNSGKALILDSGLNLAKKFNKYIDEN
ncbi:MAG: hypothetical protein RBR97_05550 [Bacteroidales bacterium]|nr:hypothetical protein [Bacteroidales bacterium]